MPKFLLQVSFTMQGAAGLKKDGASARRAYVQKLAEQLGGKLESYYFALGEVDGFLVVELPDTNTAAALGLAVNASGASHLRTVPLLTPEEMDAAIKKTVDYRPPGTLAK